MFHFSSQLPTGYTYINDAVDGSLRTYYPQATCSDSFLSKVSSLMFHTFMVVVDEQCSDVMLAWDKEWVCFIFLQF